MQPTSLQDSLVLARGPSDFCWQNSATVCAPSCPLRLLLQPWALCLQPTFQGELAVILVSLKPQGCNLWPSAAHRWFDHQCTRANRHRGRCCPPPHKLPLLRSQMQWSQVSSWSLCQQPLGLYLASFLSHFPLLMCWHGANSNWAHVHRGSPVPVRDKNKVWHCVNLAHHEKTFYCFPESCWKSAQINTLVQVIINTEHWWKYYLN